MFSVTLSDGGIMVSMVAFQAVDPGSIPGHRILFLNVKRIILSWNPIKTYSLSTNLQINFFLVNSMITQQLKCCWKKIDIFTIISKSKIQQVNSM